jgi:dienelactone hydrolase
VDQDAVRINRRSLIWPRMNADERGCLIGVYLRSSAAAIFFSLSLTSAQTIEVVPKRVMVDEPASIHVSGLLPNQRVTIGAELVDGDGEHWKSEAEFVADGQGRVGTSKQPAIAGSYKGISTSGLIWSMLPLSKKASRYQPPHDFGTQTIEFHLSSKNVELGVARLEQAAIGDGVERVIIRYGDLHGTLFSPPGKDTQQHPGVLVVGGSEGGLPSRRAAWLASHGFAALALAYFRYEDLPKELAGIPLEYFGRALTWMANRPGIAGDRIAVMGNSRGAELALQLGSMFPRIKAVAAYSPANVRYPACCGFTAVPYAWTWNGSGLAFRPLRPGATEVEMVMKSEIEVERIQGPILLISGDADHVWDSKSMADSIIARLKRHAFTFNVEHLNYAHAGHGAGRPEIIPAWRGAVRNPTSGRDVELGGTAQGNAESSLDAIQKVLDFLNQGLAAH